MQPYLVFLSSPGDVQIERDRAELVINRINAERHSQRTIQLIRWENDYYLADKSFQDQIEKPDNCDLVICIFWKKLGSELPDSYARPDGTIPTGSEYEFEVALGAASSREVKSPDVLVYRKTAEITFSLESLDQERAQYDRFMTFWQRWFRNEKGHFLAGFHSFSDPDGFEAAFDRNVRSWLNDREQSVEWRSGSPYRGLEAFQIEHAPIFFGRQRETERARARLIQAAMGGTAFLLITGASGAGKSSLARAGLIPLLSQPGGLGSLAQGTRYATLTPGEIQADWKRGVARALLEDTALGRELQNSDFGDVGMLAELFSNAHLVSAAPVVGALRRAGAEVAKEQGRAQPAHITLVLLVDQLEEIFIWPHAEAEAFLRVLRMFSTLPECPIWVVTTMRSDFQHRLAEFVDLEALAGRSEIRGPGESERTLELMLPKAGDLRAIITRPARAAGLTFETDGERDLAQLIEAQARPEVMPAIQLLLNELYQRRNGDVLTLAAFDAFGGVEGVMARRGDEVFAAASPAARDAFPRLVRALVTQLHGDSPPSARRAPEAAFTKDAGGRELIASFRLARLVTSHRGELRFAHEFILTGWDRLRTLISDERRLYEARERIEDACRRWNDATGKALARGDGLLLAGLELAEGRDLLMRWGADSLNDKQANLSDFIAASDALERRGRSRAVMVAAAAAACFALAAVLMGLLWRDADAAKKQAEVALVEAAAQRTKAASSLAVAESRLRLSEGDLPTAAGWAVQAYELLPTVESRSALFQVGIEVSPFLEAILPKKYYPPSMIWLDNDTFVTDFFNEIMGFRIDGDNLIKEKGRFFLPNKEFNEISRIKRLASGQIFVALTTGSIVAFEPNGDIYTPYVSIVPENRELQIDRILDAGQDTAIILYKHGKNRIIRTCIAESGKNVVSCKDRSMPFERNVEILGIDRRGHRLFVYRTELKNAVLEAVIEIIDETGAALRPPIPYSSGTFTIGSPDALISPNGDLLAVSFNDEIRLFDLREGAPDRSSDGKQTSGLIAWRPNSAGFSHVCQTHVICNFSVQTQVGNTLEVKATTSFAGHRDRLTDMAWNPAGTRLLSRDSNGEIMIWSDRQSREVARHLAPGRNDSTWPSVALSPDATKLLISDEISNRFEILDVIDDSGKPPVLVELSEPVTALAATRTQAFADLQSDFVIAPIRGGEVSQHVRLGQDRWVKRRGESALWSGLGEEVILRLNNDQIVVMDAPAGKTAMQRVFDDAPKSEHKEHSTSGLAIDHTRGQALVSYLHGPIVAYDIAAGKVVDVLSYGRDEPPTGVRSLSVQADGSLLAASGSSAFIDLYDLKSRVITARVKAQRGAVISVAFSPSGNKLAALDAEGKITIWDMQGARATLSLAARTLTLGEMHQTIGKNDAMPTKLMWTDNDHIILAGGIAPLRIIALDEEGWARRMTKLGYRLDKSPE
ncbi:NACHT and WD repeat domain-containing protein [Bosea sp. R86505]|uniref:NACHT and WD repeat domain-containing protein n=1 Tax=Bosea sp. R86505 TaxID=3101710 RepID=UPI00366B780D